MALELASHMDLQKVALEERLPIYKPDQVAFGWIWLPGLVRDLSYYSYFWFDPIYKADQSIVVWSDCEKKYDPIWSD